MEYNIFIFRRDLRIYDNTGLIYAIKNFDNVIPIFIFTGEQITRKNKYKSDNAIQFMIESLTELNNTLKIYFFYGDNIDILNKIKNKYLIKNIIFNMDYTPYAIHRDNLIKNFCSDNNIECHIIEDYLLKPIGSLLKKDDTPYTIFTPFKNNCLKSTIDKPNKYKCNNKNIKIKIDEYDIKDVKYKHNDNNYVSGGRTNGLLILNKVKEQKEYEKTRNILILDTTKLSAYIKFGCISIREVYWKIKKYVKNPNDLLGQIIWREFYYYIAYYFPDVLKGRNFNHKYDNIQWVNNKQHFNHWCNGTTGYPIIDAGMRQLNKTGYMHNRARLITANFLNRILNMDWRIGEQYYATKLIDYDPSVNNGNWQWIASTGVDPKPYYQRLFNPWLQGKKFDKDAQYIKKWVPELIDIDAVDIHNWEITYVKYENIYPKPIVDYKSARKKSIELYSSKI
jgi:deoxyribodipyrimidine photo-lyase